MFYNSEIKSKVVMLFSTYLCGGSSLFILATSQYCCDLTIFRTLCIFLVAVVQVARCARPCLCDRLHFERGLL